MNDETPLRGEELGKLYFQKKTSEQRLADDVRMAERQLARRPQQPTRLKVALVGSFLVAASVYLIGKVPTLWEFGSTPGISFTFLTGLL